MQISTLIASAAAGAAYTLTPGPGFLALMGIGAAQGRRAGAGFILGHFAGDVVWSSLALAAIIGANTIGPLVFDLLGLACGGYLAVLGWRAVRTTHGSSVDAAPSHRALVRGLMFGLTNPKSCPVAVATFTALLGGRAAALAWTSFPGLLLAACVGFLTADAILIAVAGAGSVRRLYRRHEILLTRASGVLFLGFASLAMANGVAGLRRDLSR